MIEYVPFNFHRHGKWAKLLVEMVLCEDTKGIVAERNNVPIGVIILDSWTHNSVQCHIGVTDPLCLTKIPYIVAEYVFITAGRKMLIGLTPSNKEKAIRLNKHFGFTEITRIPDAYADGIDYIIYQMKKEDCKYLPKEVRKAA